jgi:G3E family GTPase
MTTVHVIGGFLGAGKTTTLLGLLASRPADERVAVIVNDFGEAAIDDAIVGAAGGDGIRVAEIRGACVCCTAPENFGAAMSKLLDEVRPQRIFVEPTGLARPADLVDTLRRGPWARRIRIGPTIIVLDPGVLGEGAHPLIREQLEAADVLVANRVDLASEAALQRFDALVAGLWPAPARVVKTSFGALPSDVLDVAAAKAGDHAHDHDHDHDDRHCGHASTDGFASESRIWPADTVFSRDRLGDALARLVVGGAIARIKGLFRTDEGTFLVEVAGGRVHERASAWRRDSRVDVIATADPHPAITGIEAAILRDDERAIAADAIEVVLPDGTRRTLDRAALDGLPGGIPDVSTLIPKREGRAARVSALFDALRIPAGSTVAVVAGDGLATPPVPVEAVRTGVLVYALGDKPLPAAQGGPVRLLIPGDAGPGGACANVKGVARIVVRGPG